MTKRGRKGDTQILHGYERDRFGVTVTFANVLETEHRVEHRPGKVIAALREILEEVPPEWGVVCCSTPNTIWRDLQGPKTKLGDPSGSIYRPDS